MRVEHGEEGVEVHCVGGQVYRGHVSVGADGVRSVVRGEMRRFAEPKTKGCMDKDSKSKSNSGRRSCAYLPGLSAEFSCLYGMATALPGLEVGKIHRTWNKGFSFLIMGGKSTTYFFAFKKLDRNTRETRSHNLRLRSKS